MSDENTEPITDEETDEPEATDEEQEDETDEEEEDDVPDESVEAEKHFDFVAAKAEEAAAEVVKEEHLLDVLSEEQLIQYVTDLEEQERHLRLENMVLENFLEKHDPTLITNMNSIIEQAAIKVQNLSTQISTTPIIAETGEIIDPGVQIETAIKLGGPTFASIFDKGPRINITQRTDLVMRETEEIQTSLEDFVKRSHRIKCNLKAELEEITLRAADIKQSRDDFEETIVIEGVDKLTQRIPAEKFIRYMEEWLKNAEFTLEKLRLRTSSFKTQYAKMSKQLVLKQELSENLQAVDFEQLRIENQHYMKKCEAKNMHLLEMKKLNGRVNLMLSLQKQYLTAQVKDLDALWFKIEQGRDKVEELDRQSDRIEMEVEQAQEKYEHIKDLKANYRVPDVMDYVKVKDELYELQKSVKMWRRRINIQNIALDTCTRQMKVLTGVKKKRASWYNLSEESELSYP